MKVALGMKSHSGWAAVVVVGRNDRNYVVIDRRRIELVDEQWAKQPYHAAEGLETKVASALVKRGVEAAHRIAARELRVLINRERERQNQVAACAVLTGAAMPDWSTDQILSVHFRMHTAEGVLFRDALIHGAEAAKVNCLAVPEKSLFAIAEKTLNAATSDLAKQISALGKSVGPPWGKDQKDAALAALLALAERG
jgi:hypothetical protein